jgi:5-methyltetrahydrofolate--homocysteine methyltransferase
MIIIGEKINASRKSIAKAILSRDEKTIKEVIEKQDQAGSHYIDLNAGTGTGDMEREVEDMKWLIDLALETTGKSLTIDSPDPGTIHRAIDHLDGRRAWMLNSVKNEPRILNELLPLAASHDSPVIALAMSGEQIPGEVEERLDNCGSIAEAAGKAGIPEENLFFDPLLMPISSNYANGRKTIDTMDEIKKAYPKAKTTIGASNVSFGLPHRAAINQAFLIAAISHGLDSAICDPTRESISKAILLGRLVSGRDRHCRGFTRAARKGLFETGKGNR